MLRPPPPDFEAVASAGRAAGLDAVGVCSAEVFEATRRDLSDRRDEGLHAEMAFTYRNPERSTDPERSLPGVRSLVVGARAYPGPPLTPPADEPHGRVAAYARDDHYGVLRSGLDVVAEVLRDSGWKARILVDDNALVDRAAAHRAGLGWFGKNTNLLLPGRGSRFVLGSVLTDADFDTAPEAVPDGCGSCVRCLDSCPTGAFVRPGVLDARRCLAWLVQAAGVFPVEHRAALGDRIYGCDDCQDVCPVNRRADRDETPVAGPGDPWVPLLGILAADDETLLVRHGRWYIPRREPRYLRRNALVAIGNVADGGDERVAAALRHALADPDPIIRAHAVWAARRLGLDELSHHLRNDPDPLVRAELDAAVELAQP